MSVKLAPLLPVEPPIRLHVPVLVVRPYLESDAPRRILIDEQLAITQNTESQIDRSAIEHDQLHGQQQELLQVRLQVEVIAGKCQGRVFPEQNADIHVAIRPGG